MRKLIISAFTTAALLAIAGGSAYAVLEQTHWKADCDARACPRNNSRASTAMSGTWP